MSESRENALVAKLWSYLNYRTSVENSDAVIVLCSHDIRLADFAAKLYFEGLAPTLVFSGGLSAFTAKIYKTSEAESFAEQARSLGVPNSAIVVESASTNTQQNLEYTMAYLKEMGLSPSRAILVQKPNMLRRVYATAMKLFPEIYFSMASHNLEFGQAIHEHVAREILIHEIVGDVQRIQLYAEKGFIVPQEIPSDVLQAFHELMALGFTGNLVS